ncbi:MAG: hypothetical protein R3208_16070, partial [Ketobacteraceae bacterium]|nr:hypothetical protein [Ketobacteraceae bacterium]
MKTPAKLLLEQGPMLKTLGRIAVKTAIPIGKTATENPKSFPVVCQVLESPSKELITHYSKWAGVTDSKYDKDLPPHMFTQFALPICAKQIEMTRYNIGGIINQGCGMKIYDKIPRGQPLQVTSKVINIEENNGRARLHQRLDISAKSGTKAIEVDFYTAFIIGKGVKKKQTE